MHQFMFLKANNAYTFPGTGLGVIISGAIRVHDDMLLTAGKNNYIEEFSSKLDITKLKKLVQSLTCYIIACKSSD